MKKIIITILIIFIAAGSYVATEVKGLFRSDQKIQVDIPEGASLNKISEILREKGIIQISQLFCINAKSESKNFKAGLHTLSANMGYETIIDTLTKNPEIKGTKVVFPEGFEIKDIAKRLEENNLTTATNFINECENGDFDQTKYPFLQYITRKENRLEGYLFPATYIFPEGITDHKIIETMLDKFNQEFTSKDYERCQELGYTPDEIITLASIIEREAQGDEDRDKVSSVFHNRLNSTSLKKLQSCATVQYILGERKATLTNADTSIKSPYNTYINEGLPIGPIASPGKKSIDAALYPAKTDYYYFVFTNGKHIFSKTYEEHLNAKN